MEILLSLATALFAGLLMSRVVKHLHLPAVTGYLIAGILVGPYCLGALGVNGLGFVAPSETGVSISVGTFDLISKVALGFIAFEIGNEFRLSELRKIGRQVVIISLTESLGAVLLVDCALVALHFIMPDKISLSLAITMGAIAAATAPAATLMVVNQYKAKGKVTELLLPIVALDDAIGLIVFAVSSGAANALAVGKVSVMAVLVEPVVEIVASLILGALFGALLSFVERYFHSRNNTMDISITIVLFAVAITLCTVRIGGVDFGFSTLLVCMMLGTVFCNLSKKYEGVMDRSTRWANPVLILFFVLSGADLDFSVFASAAAVGMGIVYLIARSAGKYLGATFGAKITRSAPEAVKYLGITLLPQAGVALGMSLTAAETLGADGIMIRNIVLFGVFIYEMVGPMLSKIALTRSGDILPENLNG